MQAFLEAFAPGKRTMAYDDGEGSLPQVAGDALLHFGRADRALVDSHRDGADQTGSPEIHRLEKTVLRLRRLSPGLRQENRFLRCFKTEQGAGDRVAVHAGGHAGQAEDAAVRVGLG